MTTTTTAREQITAALRNAEALGYTEIAASNRRQLARLDAKETAVTSTEDRIIAAITELAEVSNDLVSLARVRTRIADIPRAEQDRVLKAMDRARIIQLDPDPNRKALTEAAINAAMVIGGEPKHLVSLI